MDDTSQDDGGEETVTVPMLRSTAPALMAPLQNGGTRSGQLKNLTLRFDGPGTVRATGYSGVAGTKVSIYAIPEDGYRFLKWEIPSGEGSVDNPGSASTIFTFGATDTVVQAVFIEAEQNETYVVVLYDNAMGTATATVDPTNPTTFHLTATPAAGCSFDGWNYRSGTGTIQNEQDSTTTITNCSGRVDVNAHFIGNPTCPVTATVTATANPTAGGTAEASWKDVYLSLDVDLKATPNDGYVFKEWRIKSGTGAIRNPKEAFTVLTGTTGNVDCEAVFEAISSGQYSVSLTKNKPEGGEVTASVSSGSSGTEVTLTAAPASGFRFEKWEVKAGGVTIDNPTNETATFNIGSDHVSVEACFKEEGFSVNAIAEGGGTAFAGSHNEMPGVPVGLYATNGTGVHFSHWEIVSGNITLANPYNATTSFIMGNEAVEVKAVFVPENTYCVRITNDGNGAGSPSAPSGAQNAAVTLAATPNPGYKFKEWIVIAKGGGTLSSTTDNPAQFIIGTGHASFRATFAEDPNYLYAIVYHLDGGTNDPSNPATYTKLDTITLANPTRDGHTFGGWYDNAAFNGSPVTEISAGSSGDKQFFAKWTAETYNISYQNLKGASNSNPVTYTITDTPIPLVSPTGATGYTFDGWYDNAAFSGNAITEIPANSTGDKTFYAKWTADTYNISYQNVNGASNSNPATYTIDDTPLTLVPLVGGPTGHTFDGWYDNATFSGSPVTGITANSTGDKTFYAKWTADIYNISYQNLNGASNSNPTTYTVADTITLAALPNVTGYTFDGWYETADFSGSPVTEIPKNSTENKTFWAKWTPIPYNINYELDGGTNHASNPKTYTVEDTITLADPEWTGHSFGGWYETADFSGDAVTGIPANSTGDKTFYAKWTRNSSGGGGGVATYAITIEKPENGSLTASRTTATSGMKITLTATPGEGFETDTIKVADRSGREIAVTKNDDGTYSFTMPGSKVNVTATFKAKAHDCPSAHLKDVDENAWYHEYIDYVVEKGLMQGVADDLFAPNVTTSRAMIVTILYRLEGRPAVSGASPFDDVASGQWYTDAIIWANSKGIVEGYGGGKFGTDDNITREQFAAILYRYAKFKGYDVSVGQDTNILSYDDAFEVSDWAMEAMQWAVGSGLITGRTETTLVPKGDATRAEAAAILKRFIENVK